MSEVGMRYELLQRIAEGGMGTVWVAWDRKHGRHVAAKVLRHSDASMVLRFVREQSLRIDHRHVVSPQGWSADDDHVVLSMDLVQGGSLQTLINDHGPLPESFVSVLVDQLLDGLTAIHEHGIVHRDLKPANVLLEPTGTGWPHARIGDFGIAAVIGEPRFTTIGQSIGTLGFMSPEQARGAEPEAGHDLYAVGVLGKCLLNGTGAGRLPAAGEGRLWSVLDRLTADQAADRPATAVEARAMLRTAGVVPPGPIWQQQPDAPEVFRQIDPATVRGTADRNRQTATRARTAPQEQAATAATPVPPAAGSSQRLSFTPDLPVATRASRSAAPGGISEPPTTRREVGSVQSADPSAVNRSASDGQRNRRPLQLLMIISFGLALVAAVVLIMALAG